jgi:hypothetical protein
MLTDAVNILLLHRMSRVVALVRHSKIADGLPLSVQERGRWCRVQLWALACRVWWRRAVVFSPWRDDAIETLGVASAFSNGTQIPARGP